MKFVALSLASSILLTASSFAADAPKATQQSAARSAEACSMIGEVVQDGLKRAAMSWANATFEDKIAQTTMYYMEMQAELQIVQLNQNQLQYSGCKPILGPLLVSNYALNAMECVGAQRVASSKRQLDSLAGGKPTERDTAVAEKCDISKWVIGGSK